MTKNNRQSLMAEMGLAAYNRAHGEAIGDHNESSRAYNRMLGILDGLSFAGATADRKDAFSHFTEQTEHWRSEFARNPIRP